MSGLAAAARGRCGSIGTRAAYGTLKASPGAKEVGGRPPLVAQDVSGYGVFQGDSVEAPPSLNNFHTPFSSQRQRVASREEDSLEQIDQERQPQSATVRVVVRFRPTISSVNGSEVHEAAFLVDTCDNAVESRDLQHRFNFDHVFEQDTSQQSLYNDVALPLVNNVLQGYNSTILAYGQTGGGKTYSMFGPEGAQHPDVQGLVPRAARQIFEDIGCGAGCSGKFAVECDFLEIYCEQIRDLLTPGSSSLQVKEVPHKGFYVDGLAHKPAGSTSEVLQLLRTGLRRRAAGDTKLNLHSSRSHAIFTLHVMQQTSEGPVRYGKLTLVDLAGSEKLAKSGSAGGKLEEAKKINSSLSALGHVIDALAEKRSHVPYRDSRLTRILENSLGGNCRTTLLVACSPSVTHAAETLSALRFAGRAKKVCNMVCSNNMEATPVDRHVLNRITSLRRELAKAHQELERQSPNAKADRGGTQVSRPQPTQRCLLYALNEGGDQKQGNELISDVGGTGFQSTPGMPKTPLASSRARAGASPEDYDDVEPGDSARSSNRGRRSSAPAPLESSMARNFRTMSASSSIGMSASSSELLLGSGSTTAVGSTASVSSWPTPLSSAYDEGVDDLAGRIMLSLGERGAQMHRPAGVVKTLKAVLANKRESEPEQGTVDLQIQQDLNWKLELERHRNAALNFELGRRAQESWQLRKQLEEAESRAQPEIQGWSPAPILQSTPRLASSGASMPLLAPFPLMAKPASVRSPSLSRAASHAAIHTVESSMLVDGSPQRRHVVSTHQTASVSPLRQRRFSYCAGLPRAAVVEGPASRGSPRQSVPRSATPLQKSSSQHRLYAVTSTSPRSTPQSTPHRRNPSQALSPGRHGAPPPRTVPTTSLHSHGSALVPVSCLDPPVPMVLGSATEKAIPNLREELREWVNSVK